MALGHTTTQHNRSRRSRRRLRALVLAAAATLAVPALAQATPPPEGALVQAAPPQACFGNTGGGGCTPFGAQSALDVTSLAISPDGATLFATGQNGGNGVAFHRDADGNLTVAGPAGGSGTASAVSPDGLNAYFGKGVTAATSGQVNSYSRDTGSGLLTGFVNCIEEATPPLSSCPDGTGLYDVSALAASPDGKSVYATAKYGGGDDPGDMDFTPEGSLAVFSRTGANGALNEIQCRPNFVTGGGLCQTGAATNGLNHPTDVAVSPDSRFVYAVSGASSSIVGFERVTSGPDTGKLLGPTNCLAASASNGSPDCAPIAGMKTANGLAISPDGKDIYVASLNRGIAALRRDTGSGALSFNQCLGIGTGTCDADLAIQHSLSSVAVSADGRTVYAVGSDAADGWVRSYRRDPATGKLTPLNCLSHLGAAGCTTAAGVKNVQDVEVSPDGKNVYTAALEGGDGDGAVASFTVSRAPSCSDGSATVAAGASVALPLACSDPNGDTVTRSIAGGPDHGSVGVIDQAAGTVTYTPATGFSGQDGVTFTGSDGTNAAAPAHVTIEVTPAVVVTPGSDAAPHSRIVAPARSVKARKLKGFRGTASDDRGVARVGIALVRVKPGCRTLGSGGRFATRKLSGKKCVLAGFLKAKGTGKWTFKLRHRLPRGRYVLYSRATDSAGHSEAAFTLAAGNRAAFRVR
jgi:hypothetical protein